MNNSSYLDLPAAKINYNVKTADLTSTGVYNLSVTYTWGGAGADTSTVVSFTLTL